MIVFDFHGCLSLSSKDIKKYNLRNILDEVSIKEIDPYFLMPTLDDVIQLVDMIKIKKPDVKFAIASMLEDEKLMYDIVKYCFESKGKKSPFEKEFIISGHHFDKKLLKIPHIEELLKKNNLNLGYSDIILIDDTPKIINHMRSKGIFSVYVKKYFTLDEWSREMKKRSGKYEVKKRSGKYEMNSKALRK